MTPRTTTGRPPSLRAGSEPTRSATASFVLRAVAGFVPAATAVTAPAVPVGPVAPAGPCTPGTAFSTDSVRAAEASSLPAPSRATTRTAYAPSTSWAVANRAVHGAVPTSRIVCQVLEPATAYWKLTRAMPVSASLAVAPSAIVPETVAGTGSIAETGAVRSITIGVAAVADWLPSTSVATARTS